MILAWTDSDGDPVAVESASIVGVSVGRLTGPHRAGEDITVTLVWAVGIGQPFIVRQPFQEVYEAWVAARDAGGTTGRPGFHGWPLQYPHPSSTLPGGVAWGSDKRGTP